MLDALVDGHARDVRAGDAASRAVVRARWTRGRARGTPTAHVDLAATRGERAMTDAILAVVERERTVVTTRDATRDATATTTGRGRRSGAFGYKPDAEANATVVLDCASKIRRAYGEKALIRVVRALRRHRNVCLVVTLGVGTATARETCEAEASCVATCEPAEGDDDGSRARLDVEIRRACGRRRRERERVIIRDDDSLEFAPCEAESVEDAVARALRVGDDDAETRAARRLQAVVPFNLGVSLTAEEREAKRNVKLSYEHQGVRGVEAYDTGDFLAYLPPDAGGRGVALGVAKPGRGHIYYERDAADEDLDDDDLHVDTDDELEEDY